MSTFIRGPVCGVDNCPSRLWRIIAGRRTCQYGHVMEGDIEFNNDDDDAGGAIITRRLNLTTNALGSFQSSLNLSQLDGSDNISQGSRKSKKIYGIEADIIYIKSFQYILKKQCTFLIESEHLPTNLQNIVKLIWINYLNFLDKNKNVSNNLQSGQITDTDLDHEIPDTQDSSNYSQNNQKKYKKLGLHLTTMIAVLYLSCVHMKIPFYLCDFIRIIAAANFPYLKASSDLPKIWRDKLPNYYLLELQSNKLPSHLQIMKKIYSIHNELRFDKLFDDTFNTEGLLFKLNNMTILPPEFYIHTKTLISLILLNGKKKNSKNKEIHLFNMKDTLTKTSSLEIIIISSFLLTLRWILLFDGVHTDVQSYSNSWLKAILKNEILSSFDLNNTNIQRRITKLLTKSTDLTKDENVFKWSKDKTSSYLNWIERNFLPKQMDQNESTFTIDERIAFRKLNNIVPLDSSVFPLNLKSFQNEKSFVEELQDKHLKIINLANNFNNDVSNNETLQEERFKLICQVEDKLIKHFSIEFNITNDNLKNCINDIEENCLQVNIQIYK